MKSDRAYHTQTCFSARFFFLFFFCRFHFVLQTSSEVRPRSQPVGAADVFNGTWFVSWWRDKHGEEIKTPGFLPQSPAFILHPIAMVMQGLHSRLLIQNQTHPVWRSRA